MSTADVVAQATKSSHFRSLCSFIGSRAVFLFLLCADLIWLAFLLGKTIFCACLQVVFLGSSETLRKHCLKGILSARYSLVCALCLIISFFSPAFGVMVGYAYFIVYDKQGPEGLLSSGVNDRVKEILSARKSI